MNREECLEEAKKCVCIDRNAQYGEPEDNFKIVSEYWNLYLKGRNQLSAKDVAIMMTLLKVARLQTGNDKDDSYIDAIGYLACGCEIQSKSKIVK